MQITFEALTILCDAYAQCEENSFGRFVLLQAILYLTGAE